MVTWAPVRLVAPLVMTWLAACGGEPAGPVDASLRDLATRLGAYEASLVRTEGVVQGYEDATTARHFWIEDEDQHRVALEPPEVAAALLDHHVRVVGRFFFSEETGRRIEVTTIEPRP